MNTEPYRIFWDDELWLARRLREASADPAGEDRRQTASGKKDSGISRITDGKSPNGESRVPQPFAGTEVPGEKRLPAAISRQTDPETETAFNPAGPETKHSGYGQATERGSSRLSEESRRAIRETVNERLSELRVYVLESDITEAQQAVKSVVEQASF